MPPPPIIVIGVVPVAAIVPAKSKEPQKSVGASPIVACVQ